MTATVLPFQVLEAPENWRTVDFISDLHLQENDTATFDVWQKYMQNTTADAVFILGDLFEVWVGDDAAQHHVFLQQCAAVLKSCSTLRHVAFMRGNRDFLVGTSFLNACHVQDLQDPTLVNFATQKILLSHGDAGCLADTSYQEFRHMVRQPAWQTAFLAKPLEERERIARELRSQSEMHKQNPNAIYADVDDSWSRQWLVKTQATKLVHGHTHRPADHSLGLEPTMKRYVLSDWDVASDIPRAEALRWHSTGKCERINLLTH
jgi:UDP-2,3-diacylglucosamine hydrolase